MNPLTSSNRFYSGLFSDPSVVAVFSTEAAAEAFRAYEIALTEALAEAGVVSTAQAQEATARMRRFAPDIAEIESATAGDGVPVPAFVRQLKAHVGAELAGVVHIGATSHDLIDTAMVLAFRAANDILSTRLDRVSGMLADLDQNHGTATLMGRTRMQAALPITVSDRLAAWRNRALMTLRNRSAVAAVRWPI